MPTLKRPDVYTQEFLATSRGTQDPSSSVAAFMGEHWRGPTTLTSIGSWTEFVNVFGGFAPTGVTLTNKYLAFAVFAWFNNGGGRCYVARVSASGSPATAYENVVDRAGSPLSTLRIAALNYGTWGNNLRFDIVTRDAANGRFDLVVKYGGATDAYIVEKWTDLTMDDTDARYAPTIVNFLEDPDGNKTGSVYVALTDLDSATTAPNNMPAAQVGSLIDTVAGTDGTAPGTTEYTAAVTATTSPLDAFPALQFPIMVNLPGVSTASVQNALIALAEARGDLFCVLDPASARSVSSVVSDEGGLTDSGYRALYYPWLTATDPSSSAPNATRLLPPGGYVMGQIARTDAHRGVWKAPAGTSTKLKGVVALERKLSDTDLDTLNNSNVNAIRHIPGAGIVVMGARTGMINTADKYIPIRRTLNQIKSWITVNTRWAIFEPNDSNLWGDLEMQIQQYLTGIWNARGLRGETAAQAFYVKCDGELNTPSVIASGEVRIEVGLAFQYPAEFVVFRIGQWEGGAAVQEV